MFEDALNLTGSILYLASAIGALGFVCFILLPEAYCRWIEAKHQIDLTGDTYASVVEALSQAQGRPIRIVLADDIQQTGES